MELSRPVEAAVDDAVAMVCELVSEAASCLDAATGDTGRTRWRLVHETGMCEAIVDATLRRAAGRRVTGVRVLVGGHAVDRDVVVQGIQLAAGGTVAEDLDVDLVLEPMSVHCGSCGRTAPVTDHLAMVACPPAAASTSS